jgi:hypothetical protein
MPPAQEPWKCSAAHYTPPESGILRRLARPRFSTGSRTESAGETEVRDLGSWSRLVRAAPALRMPPPGAGPGARVARSGSSWAGAVPPLDQGLGAADAADRPGVAGGHAREGAAGSCLRVPCRGAVSVRLAVGWCARGLCPSVWRLSGCLAEPRGLAVFDPLTGRLPWRCRFGICPGRTPGRVISAGLREGRFEREWLFCWLWRVAHIFEKILLPVGTAGFEPATP